MELKHKNIFVDFLKHLTNIFNYGGHESRIVFWPYYLINLIIFVFCIFYIGNHYLHRETQTTIFLCIFIFIGLPSFSACIRRLKDAGFSPFFVLLGFLSGVKFIGIFIYIYYLYMLAQPTKTIGNKYVAKYNV